jgi:hypothetical protein
MDRGGRREFSDQGDQADELAEKAGTMVLASRREELLKRTCNRRLESERGKVGGSCDPFGAHGPDWGSLRWRRESDVAKHAFMKRKTDYSPTVVAEVIHHRHNAKGSSSEVIVHYVVIEN